MRARRLGEVFGVGGALKVGNPASGVLVILLRETHSVFVTCSKLASVGLSGLPSSLVVELKTT